MSLDHYSGNVSNDQVDDSEGADVLGSIRRNLHTPERRQWLDNLASLPRHEFSSAEIADTIHNERRY